MHGITHLYRQHAIEKQLSSDSWQNGVSGQHQHHHLHHQHTSYGRSYSRDSDTSSVFNSSSGGGNTSNNEYSLNNGANHSSSSSNSSTNSKSPNSTQGKKERVMKIKFFSEKFLGNNIFLCKTYGFDGSPIANKRAEGMFYWE